MHGGQTLVARGDQEGNDRGLKSLAISAASLTLFPSNRQREDRCCAATALALIALRSREREASSCVTRTQESQSKLHVPRGCKTRDWD